MSVRNRVGLLFRKVGSSAVFTEDGSRLHVTLLKLDESRVISIAKLSDSLFDIQLGCGEVKQDRLSKPMAGHFAKLGVNACKKLFSCRVFSSQLDVGDAIDVRHFIENQYVDVSGTSIGKGFAGVMKRHNFSGLAASHGVSATHRSLGSTGQCQNPGRVMKGKKMPGRMGATRVTVQNLRVVSVDVELGVLVVRGAVPGHKGSYVMVRDAIKKSPVNMEKVS